MKKNKKETQALASTQALLSGHTGALPQVRKVVDAVKERLELERKIDELDLYIYTLVSGEGKAMEVYDAEVVGFTKRTFPKGRKTKVRSSKKVSRVVPFDEEADSLRKQRMLLEGGMSRKLPPDLASSMQGWVEKHVKQYTMPEMAGMLGVADITVGKWLRKRGLKAKPATVVRG